MRTVVATGKIHRGQTVLMTVATTIARVETAGRDRAAEKGLNMITDFTTGFCAVDGAVIQALYRSEESSNLELP